MGGQYPRPEAAALAADTPIPDKLYFKIGEVAQLVGVEPHVLRYWEREVSLIRPTKSPSNQRRYRRRDIELFRDIRRLLYEEGYTLAGARRRIMAGEDLAPTALEPAARESTPPGATQSQQQLRLGFPAREHEERLERVRAGLRELIRLVGEDP